MKKLILLALITLMMVGCVEKESNDNIAVNTGAYNPHTSIIDSCEYVKWGYGLSHKGNCRFCEERDSIKWEKRKKELKELIIKLK
jgi:hypothetical protein